MQRLTRHHYYCSCGFEASWRIDESIPHGEGLDYIAQIIAEHEDEGPHRPVTFDEWLARIRR